MQVASVAQEVKCPPGWCARSARRRHQWYTSSVSITCECSRHDLAIRTRCHIHLAQRADAHEMSRSGPPCLYELSMVLGAAPYRYAPTLVHRVG